MTDIEYASRAVKPVRKNRFIGYDLRFQKVRSMKPIAPNRESHIIHVLVLIQVLYPVLKKDTAESAAVARSCTVLYIG